MYYALRLMTEIFRKFYALILKYSEGDACLELPPQMGPIARSTEGKSEKGLMKKEMANLVCQDDPNEAWAKLGLAQVGGLTHLTRFSSPRM